MKDLKKYNIRGIQIEKPILRTWTLYNDKSGSRAKDYDSMIIKAEYLIQELEKNILNLIGILVLEFNNGHPGNRTPPS